MRRGVVAVLALLVLVAAVGPVHAQRITGQIVGTVTDTSGGALPGVTVNLKGEAVVGVQTATTNEKGFYRFVNLPPGTYTVTFSPVRVLDREPSGGQGERRPGHRREREPRRRACGGGHGRRRGPRGGHPDQHRQHQLRQGLGPQRARATLQHVRPARGGSRAFPRPPRAPRICPPSDPAATRTRSRSTGRTSRRPPPVRPGPIPTPTPSRRSRFSPSAPRPSTATSPAPSSTW